MPSVTRFAVSVLGQDLFWSDAIADVTGDIYSATLYSTFSNAIDGTINASNQLGRDFGSSGWEIRTILLGV